MNIGALKGWKQQNILRLFWYLWNSSGKNRFFFSWFCQFYENFIVFKFTGLFLLDKQSSLNISIKNLLRRFYYVAWLFAFSCLVYFISFELFRDINKRHPIVLCKSCSKSETGNATVWYKNIICFILLNSYIFQSLRVVIRLKFIKIGVEHL